MTRKEANAILRERLGDQWHEIDSDRSLQKALMRGEPESKVFRIAPAKPKRAKPARKAPKPKPRAKPKRAKPRAKPMRKPAPKPRKTRAKPKPKSLRVMGAGEHISREGGGTVRPFVVVQVAPGKNRAFYMSSGQGSPGMTPTGTWVNFGGQAYDGWFIKPTREAGSKLAYPEVSAQLGDALGRSVEEFRERMKGRALLIVGSTTADRDREIIAQERLNKYLAELGAIEEYLGPQEWRRPEDRPGERRFKTVQVAPRHRFNPKK